MKAYVLSGMHPPPASASASALAASQAEAAAEAKTAKPGPPADGVKIDVSFILLQMLLPGLVDFFLCFELARTLNDVTLLTACGQRSPRWNEYYDQPVTCITVGGETCVYDNSTAAWDRVSGHPAPFPALVSTSTSSLPPSSRTASYLGDTVQNASALRWFGGISMLAILLCSAYAAIFRYTFKAGVLILVQSLLCTFMELVALFVLITGFSGHDQVLVFWKAPFYLMMATLFSTLFAILAILAGEGEASVLSNMGVYGGKRKAILVAFLFFDLFATVINCAGLHYALQQDVLS